MGDAIHDPALTPEPLVELVGARVETQRQQHLHQHDRGDEDVGEPLADVVLADPRDGVLLHADRVDERTDSAAR